MVYVPIDPEEKEKRITYIQSALNEGKKWAEIGAHIGMKESAVAHFWYRYGNTKKETNKRQCMCCKRDFESEGKHNRLCIRCKTERTPSPWEVVVGASRQVGKG
jgi:hypothetical protein